MLRRARWILLLAIAALATFVASTFITQRDVLNRNRPASAKPLPDNTSATAQDWEYDIKEGHRTKVNLRARSFQQIKEPSTVLLQGLQMRIFDKEGKKFDLVKTASATFDAATGVLYSEGEVDITMNLPQEDQPAGRLLHIRSSGMTFEVSTSKVWTDRHATFDFDRGNGEATGATYDPATRELFMKSAVKLNWHGDGSPGAAMQVESGSLTYKELTSEVYLQPWSKLTRGTMTMNAANSVVFLKDGAIERVEAVRAQGVDKQPQRQIDYAADRLLVFFTPKTEIQKIEGTDNARLVSTTPTGITTVTTNRMDLDFAVTAKGSLLTRALATGKSRVVSDPVARATSNPPTRVLISDVIELAMRAGGEEIEQVRTHSPAEVQFLPAKAGDKRRQMNSERMVIDYAAANMVKSVRAMKNVVTRTETPAANSKVNVSTTRSNELLANFDTKTGQMSTLEQWDAFQYEEGLRRATASHATMDSTRDLITLKSQARIWDNTGSTTADTIVMQQSSGDMTATGNVSSTRLPDQRDKNTGMIRGDEALRAQAQRMTTANRNLQIRYEGDAVMWQGANRLRAQTIQIDREKGTLAADKNVVSTMPEQKEGQAPALTTVRSDSMVYRDDTKLALYRGNARLEKPGLDVTARQIRLWFRDEPDAKGNSQTTLDRMFADGAVNLSEQLPGRTRKGSGEHIEYYTDEERMVLNGGNPVVTDSKKGTSRGREITWFSRQDRLIVDNTGSGPSVSRIPREQRQ